MILPFVSVIIPVYNDATLLLECLRCLNRQSYPKERFEVLVVDNGSELSPKPVVGAFPFAKYLFEQIPSSYAARNCGILSAEGDVLAFTDADCRPEKHWLENGTAALTQQGTTGLIAGRIDVFFRNPETPTWVELYEREFAFRQEENTILRHYGATANVFTTKDVFARVGMFDASLKSGGDREFGNRVHAAGLPVRYTGNAVVAHPARYSTSAFFAKMRRTTHGHYALKDQEGKQHLFEIPSILRSFIPPLSVLNRIGQSGAPLSRIQKVKIAGFVFTSRYYNNLLRLKLAMFGEKNDAPR